MAHYAKIEDGLVVDVIVASASFVASLDGEWVKTSYNTYGNQHANGKTPLRGNYAGIGYVYDSANDVFYTQQPYPSWQLNIDTWLWEAPVSMPQDGNDYLWNEEQGKWDICVF